MEASNYLPWFLGAPFAGTVAMVVVHTLICRRSGEQRFLGGVATAFIFGLVVFVIAQSLLLVAFGARTETLFLAIGVNIPLYVFLAYCYYNFVNLGHASIRIRIYAECLEHGGAVSGQRLAAVYNDELLKSSRIRRLLEGGDMMQRDNVYVLGAMRLVPVALFVFGLKKFVLGRLSEFDHPA